MAKWRLRREYSPEEQLRQMTQSVQSTINALDVQTAALEEHREAFIWAIRALDPAVIEAYRVALLKVIMAQQDYVSLISPVLALRAGPEDGSHVD
jgi:nitrate/nitrite-specific signal transduction histidine kinase